MSGHTPGPWIVKRANLKVDGAYDWAVGADIDDGLYCIAEAVGRAAEDVWLPAEANARLIAAAPDALERPLRWREQGLSPRLPVDDRQLALGSPTDVEGVRGGKGMQDPVELGPVLR